MAAQTTGLLGLLNIQLASQRCDVVLAPREGCLNVGGRRVMSFVVSRSNMMLGRCRIVWKQNLAVPKAAVPGRRHVWVAGEDSKHLKPIRPSSPSRRVGRESAWRGVGWTPIPGVGWHMSSDDWIAWGSVGTDASIASMPFVSLPLVRAFQGIWNVPRRTSDLWPPPRLVLRPPSADVGPRSKVKTRRVRTDSA